MIINQFHSGTAPGDAITNQMLFIQQLLRKRGFESEIYAEHIPQELEKQIKNIKNYKGNKDGILLVHHSMGFDCFDRIIGFEDKRILIYHNITPEEFFTDATIIKYIRLGHKQLIEYKDHICYAIADSNYNRKQLLQAGYKCPIEVMPVNISLDRFDHCDFNKELSENIKNTTNILFVGRIVRNKRQDEIVKTFILYNRYFNSNSRLFLVGGVGDDLYANEIRQLIHDNNLEDKAILTGKVSENDLKTYYQHSNLFLCLSDHEGFGVPLLEAMKMNVPVIAYDSSAISETLSNAGILVLNKNYPYIAALIDEVINNKELREDVVRQQQLRIKKNEDFKTSDILLDVIKSINDRKISLQMQGPFETSYSLAIVNRNLSEALDRQKCFDVSIYATEGPGDYIPKEDELKDKPVSKQLWQKSQKVFYPDVTIRNMYPPRVYDVNGALNFQSFGWEESYIPKEYISDFNKYLDGIGTTSEFVTQTLIENGLKIPVKTIGNGVVLPNDFEAIKRYPVKTKKKTKFLHISSAFPRKGVDILLEAYCKAFTSDDDVCLILKTFPNPHNTVESIIDSLKKQYPQIPEIEWINKDLSEKEIYGLYKSASCYVQVSRGEGFGLPVAEAMLTKLPVIVSANSGLSDFCNDTTSITVKYKKELARTHVNAGGQEQSFWFEPDVSDLEDKFKKFYSGFYEEKLDKMKEEAFLKIKNDFSWESVAEKWKDFIFETQENKYRPKVSLVTTWNTKCGIAEFNRMEVNETKSRIDYYVYPNYGEPLLKKDEPYVKKRVWNKDAINGKLTDLIDCLSNDNSEIVNIHINLGFYSLTELQKLIEQLHGTKKIVLTFHEVKDVVINHKKISLSTIKDSINICDRLIVHQEEDKTILTNLGIKEEIISIVPLGQGVVEDIPKEYQRKQLGIDSSFVVGSYGFLLPHKGIKETIKAITIIKRSIPDIHYLAVCSLFDAPESKNYYNECITLINELGLQDNVTMISDFLQNKESMMYLQCCDALIMPYLNTQQSASGAMRFCMAARRPVITTSIPIFNEFKKYVIQIKNAEPELISDAVIQISESKDEEEYAKKSMDYLKNNSWTVVSKQLYNIYKMVLGMTK